MNLNFWRRDDNNNLAKPDHLKKDVEGDSFIKGAVAEDNNFESIDDEFAEPTNREPVKPASREFIEPADPEKAKFYNNISRWCLYLSVFLMPLFFLPFTTNVLELNKLMLLLVAVSIGMIAWLLGVVSSGYLAWRNNPVDKGVLIFLAAFILSAIFSVDSFKSVMGLSAGFSNILISAVVFTVLYFLVVNNSENRAGTIKSLLGLSLVIAFIYGLIQVFGFYFLPLSFAKARAFNTVGSLNSLGILAAVSLPLFSKCRINLRWLKQLYLEKIGLVSALFILFILNWWILWMVAIAGMVSMVIFENISGGRFKINKFILPMAVVILGVFMMVVKLDLKQLKNNLPAEINPSFSLSTDVAMSVLKERPFFGYGLENFSIAFDRYGAGRFASSTLFNVRFSDATSEFLTLLVHGGSAMAIGFLAMLISVCIMFWRFRKSLEENHDRTETQENIGLLASFTTILTAMFLYPLNFTLMFVFYVLMGLSVLAIYDSNKKEFNIESNISLSLGSSLGFIGGLILALVGIYYGSVVYIGDVKYAQALAEGDKNNSAGLLVEALNWNNKDDRYYRSASQKAIELLAEELKKSISPDRDARIQNYVTTSVNLAKRATEITSKEALNWANLGFIYQNLLTIIDGVDGLSEEAYLKGSELRPGDPIFAYRVGMIYLSKFDRYNQLIAARRVNPDAVLADARVSLDKAEKYLKEATILADTFGLAIYSLGNVYERKGELAEAIEQLEKVAPANSNLPSLAFELGLLYYRAGRKEDAFNALQRAVFLAPDYANARWYLALIYEERGGIDSAIGQLEKILSVEINKGHPVVAQKLNELKAGKTQIPPGSILDQQPIR